MKKLSMLFCTAFFVLCAALTFAGNRAEVIIPGDHTPKYFRMPPNLKEGDYLPNTIIFKVKPQFRQNCKVNSVDNLLPVQDFLQAISAENVAKIYPHHEAPAQERNMLGQKLVDLSLIYSFKYSANMKLEKAINQLLSLGYFEYVEPWYVPKINLNPNDPKWPLPVTSTSGQYHLQGNVAGSINTVTAWNTTTGSASVVIGIVDSGTEPAHPDLAANYAGGYDVAMNDNDPTFQGTDHGVLTSGDACAVTNNGVGVASPGYNCKFKCAKVGDASGNFIAAYQGITWAADNGCKIINCSWGGPAGGSYGQNIVDYAAINKNCLVIAAAGNGGIEVSEWPSSYNNVYRVASSTNADAKSGFSSYGFDVDFAAPGGAIFSTGGGGTYRSASGTSMSSPVSAGAAGLVQSKFNYSNAFQIGERLKQTADPMSASSEYTAGKLGKGRINVGVAVSSAAAKSLAMNPITVTDGNDNIFMPNENLSISGTFINYLDPSGSATSAALSIVSGPGTVTNGNFTIGALATLAATNNTSSPFTVSISGSAPVNSVIKFKVHITDGVFSSDQYFDITVNFDYINIVNNDVHTSITSKGRIGYNLDGQQEGLGFEYQVPSANNMLYEMSLMIGTSSAKVSDMFRETSSGNADFASVVRVSEVTPAPVSDFDVEGKFNDAPSASGVIPVEVHHKAFAWSAAPYRKFVIVKYVIKNTGASTLSNLYAGIVADWDITAAGQNKSAYDPTYQMGYCYDLSSANGLYAGIKCLSNLSSVKNYCIDNVSGGNGGIDVATANGFSTALKYTALSTSRNADGFPATGGDVMNCVSNGPFAINAGDSIEVAFALIGGNGLVDLQASACAAQSKYDNGCANVGVNDLENDNLWMYSFPNPATSSVNIRYNISGYENASIRIMNSLGETVITLGNLVQGNNMLTLDVSKLSSGNYFYQMRAGEAVMTKKMTIVR